MFHSLLSLFLPGHTELSLLSQPIRFAAVESLVMHTRIIADMLLSRDTFPDSIRLQDLLPDFTPSKLDELRESYGNRNKKNSPCWTINKMWDKSGLMRKGDWRNGEEIRKWADTLTARKG